MREEVDRRNVIATTREPNYEDQLDILAGLKTSSLSIKF